MLRDSEAAHDNPTRVESRRRRIERLMTPVPPQSRLLHSAGVPPDELTIARAIRVLSAGNHHPLLCEMEDRHGPVGIWVVKPCVVLSRATDRGTFGILAELAGAEVCAWAGVLAPRVALTRFPDHPDAGALRIGASAVDPPEREEIVEIFRANRHRLAFCVRFLEGAPDLARVHLRRKKWRSSSLADATRLLVADLYMRHDDRLEENPNAVWHENRLVAIDHGSAFAGLLRPGVRGEHLAAQTQPHAPNFAQHIAFEAVARHGTEPGWEEAVTRLEGVPPHAITALRASWPAELDHDEQNGQQRLRSRLAQFLATRSGHVRELVAVLRATMRRKP